MKHLLLILSVLTLVIGSYFFIQTPRSSESPLGADTRTDTIRETLTTKTHRERLEIKATEIPKLQLIGVHERANLTIEIRSIARMEGGVEVVARAWNRRGAVGFGDGTVEWERFKVHMNDDGVNSHLSWLVVPDPQGDIVLEEQQIDLAGNPITVTTRYREDPQEHLLMFLERLIAGLQTHDGSKIKPGRTGNTVTSFTAGSAGDGQVRRGPNTQSTWAAARDTADGTTAIINETEAFFYIGDREAPAANFTINRLFFPFDTSALPDTDTIDSATVTFRQTGSNGEGDRAVGLIQTSQAATTTLGTGDYDALTVNSPAEGAARVTFNDNDSDRVFTLNATGLGWITKSTTTLLGLRGGYDIDNTTPASRNYSQIAFSDNATAAYRPTLAVTHSAGGGGGGTTPNQDIILFE